MDSAISTSMAARHASVSDSVSMAVLRKTMDAQQAEGSQMVAMIARTREVGQAAERPACPAGGLDLYA